MTLCRALSILLLSGLIALSLYQWIEGARLQVQVRGLTGMLNQVRQQRNEFADLCFTLIDKYEGEVKYAVMDGDTLWIETYPDTPLVYPDGYKPAKVQDSTVAAIFGLVPDGDWTATIIGTDSLSAYLPSGSGRVMEGR